MLYPIHQIDQVLLTDMQEAPVGAGSPQRAVRGASFQQVEHTRHCLVLAYQMGIPSIRLNSGRWGTVDFDRLMELRGEEPPLPGYTDEDAFAWCIQSIEECLPTAESLGVTLALENHWGLTRHAAGVLRIVEAIRSPWLAVLMDTGNFLEAPYAELEALAPHAV